MSYLTFVKTCLNNVSLGEGKLYNEINNQHHYGREIVT